MVVVLGACDTEPAIDVTQSQATLRAKGACYAGASGWWRYQIRDASNGGSFFGVGPQVPFSCGSNTGEYALQSYRVGGLISGHLYQFRVRAQLDSGQVLNYDSVGTEGGTNYDAFWTRRPDPYVIDDNTGDVPVVAPDSGDLAAGASAASRCKRGLNNIRNRYFVIDGSLTKIYFGGQRTNWCWTGGSIVRRHTEFPKGYTAAVSSGSVDYYVWSSSCQTGNASCLVRAEFLARMDASFPVIGITIGVNETYCVGTRVYAGGAHSRNISGGSCPGDGSVSMASARRLEGLLGEVVPTKQQQSFARLAFSQKNQLYMEKSGKLLPRLLRMGRRLWSQLTPEQRHELRREMR
jgi:hypothetical protein